MKRESEYVLPWTARLPPMRKIPCSSRKRSSRRTLLLLGVDLLFLHHNTPLAKLVEWWSVPNLLLILDHIVSKSVFRLLFVFVWKGTSNALLHVQAYSILKTFLSFSGKIKGYSSTKSSVLLSRQVGRDTQWCTLVSNEVKQHLADLKPCESS